MSYLHIRSTAQKIADAVAISRHKSYRLVITDLVRSYHIESDGGNWHLGHQN